MTGFDFKPWLVIDGKSAKILRNEDDEYQWAYYGQVLNSNLMRWSFEQAINRALTRTASHTKVAAMIRTYLNTGVLP